MPKFPGFSLGAIIMKIEGRDREVRKTQGALFFEKQKLGPLVVVENGKLMIELVNQQTRYETSNGEKTINT